MIVPKLRKLFIITNIYLFFIVKAEVVEPGCRLPQNFSGYWVNTANMDADVFINETHVIETWYPDEARFRRTIYVCREQRGSRYMMARLTVDGWYKNLIYLISKRSFNVIKVNYYFLSIVKKIMYVSILYQDIIILFVTEEV